MPAGDPNATMRAMKNLDSMIFRRHPVVRLLLLVAVGVAGLTGCDDPFGAFLLDVPEIPTEATLFDFATARLEDPSAFDVIRESTVRVDQTNQWDFLYRAAGGVPELLPFGAVADTTSDAGLLRAESSFEGVLEAPGSGYDTSSPMAIAEGDVFIVRSRRDLSSLLICNRFAKLEVLDVDLAAGTMTFRMLSNPNCGDRVLEPGTHGNF